MPFGLLLLFPARRVPLPARRERERRNLAAVGYGANLGILTEVSDKGDFVKTPTHCASRRDWLRSSTVIGARDIHERATPLTSSMHCGAEERVHLRRDFCNTRAFARALRSRGTCKAAARPRSTPSPRETSSALRSARRRRSRCREAARRSPRLAAAHPQRC